MRRARFGILSSAAIALAACQGTTSRDAAVPSETGADAPRDAAVPSETGADAFGSRDAGDDARGAFDAGTPYDAGLCAATDASASWSVDSLSATSVSPPGGDPALFFGDSLAMQGDLLVVGWPRATVDGVFEAGAVHVFRRTATGGWSLATVLRADTPVEHQNFGLAIALSYGTLLVSARTATQVYVDGPAGLTPQARLPAYGSFAIWGDVVVGVRSEGGCCDCSVELSTLDVFERSGADFVHVTHRQWYGCEAAGGLVAASDQLLVHVDHDGTLHAYERGAIGWIEAQTLAPPTPYVPTSIALERDVLAVGAPYDPPGGAETGAVHVYRLQPGTWGHEHWFWEHDTTLTAPAAIDHDYFGISVAVSQQTLVAGLTSSTSSSADHPGRALVFERCGSEWRSAGAIARNVPDDDFGYAVAASWPSIAVAQPSPGRVWVYEP